MQVNFYVATDLNVKASVSIKVINLLHSPKGCVYGLGINQCKTEVTYHSQKTNGAGCKN